MSSRVLGVDELSFEAYSEFYLCLKNIHGENYANMVCGDPEAAMYFEGFSYNDLEKSFKTQTCIECGTYITKDELEECTFEGVEEGGDDDIVHVFYMCTGCLDDPEG